MEIIKRINFLLNENSKLPKKYYNVFAFGTLMDNEFLKKLLGRSIDSESAILNGYEKIQVIEYPFAVKKASAKIKGKLLLNLTNKDMKKIDNWERTPQNYYIKTKVIVQTESGFKEVLAYITDRKHIKDKN